jgi:hypothetical protein
MVDYDVSSPIHHNRNMYLLPLIMEKFQVCENASGPFGAGIISLLNQQASSFFNLIRYMQP